MRQSKCKALRRALEHKGKLIDLPLDETGYKVQEVISSRGVRSHRIICTLARQNYRLSKRMLSRGPR